MSKLLLQANKIGFVYGNKNILENISLDLYAKQTLAIVGPNGAGKTTLLKILADLLKPQTGEIILKEINKKEIAYLAQHETLPPDFTAQELVALGRLPHQQWFENPWRKQNQQDKIAIHAAMQATDTLQFATRSLATLSGGEAQRVALARALAQTPKLLLLDEPTNHLDLSHQSDVLRVLRRQTTEISTVMILHDLNLAALCDRVILMAGGNIMEEGKPEKVLTTKTLQDAYGKHLQVLETKDGRPVVIPT